MNLFSNGKFVIFSLFMLALMTYNSSSQAQSYSSELASIIPKETRLLIEKKLSSKWSNSIPFTKQEIQILTSDFSSLYELRGTPIKSQLFKKIFLMNQFDGRPLVDWILQKFILLVPSRGSLCAGSPDSQYQGCFTPSEKKIRLSPLYFKQGRLSRLSTLIHEARHSQGFPHLSNDSSSEDGVIEGARGAEWSFFAAISASCTNCRLMDRLSAYKSFIDVSLKIKHLNSMDQVLYSQELSALKDPLDEKYTPLANKLKKERNVVHIMPSLCLGKVPFNEFKGDPEITPSEDCAILYYFVDASLGQINPALLKRSTEYRDGFLVILNPVAKTK
jgi:hypothetical protein